MIGLIPGKREPGSPKVVHRSAKCGLRLTPAQKDRVFGLLRSAPRSPMTGRV